MLCDGCYKTSNRRFNPYRGRSRDRIVPVATRTEWIEAIQEAWDTKENCLRCRISGVRLVPDDPSSPLYPTLDHSDPGAASGGWLVVAAVINDMKSDLDMAELKKVLPLLSRMACGQGNKEDQEQLEGVLKDLRHWKRVKKQVVVEPSLGTET
jgi:hypothetical protein